MPLIEVRWDNPEPHSVTLEVTSERLMRLFEDTAFTKGKVEGLEQKHNEGMIALNKRIDTLWQVILAGFVASIGILGSLVALFNGAF